MVSLQSSVEKAKRLLAHYHKRHQICDYFFSPPSRSLIHGFDGGLQISAAIIIETPIEAVDAVGDWLFQMVIVDWLFHRKGERLWNRLAGISHIESR